MAVIGWPVSLFAFSAAARLAASVAVSGTRVRDVPSPLMVESFETG
jgi:hypothetical protein